MRVLYQRTEKEVPNEFIPSAVQKDILDNWKHGYNLFSISQIADRTGSKRGHVKRQVRLLINAGLVSIWVPKRKE